MKILNSKIGLFVILINLLFAHTASATSIAQYPLFLTTSVPPIVMLNMGRDHKLYYEAYNDASDLDGDGTIDFHYKPDVIDYFGYFDSFKCYDYTSGIFVPSSATLTKKCSGNWSGDFLNYVTTSRMDALRKVLYGGFRSTDDTSSTILKRAFIPQDAHSWGKEYTSVPVDGYDISQYTPLSLPTAGRRHLFANTTLTSASSNPLLRVLQNRPQRIWEWVSIELPVAGNEVIRGETAIPPQDPNERISVSPTDYNVFVQTCVAGLEESNCKVYSDGTTQTFKPIGILQRYGDDELMAFGLLTGSYENNLQGGVLRKNIASFRDEINLDTGEFTNVSGIVDTIDKLRIAKFNYSKHRYEKAIFNRSVTNGEVQDWGNPVAEMMYEVLRYFSGETSGKSDFTNNVATGTDNTLQLPLPAWKDPYDTANGGFQYCAKPIQMVISDVNASYDTDQIPGSAFDGYSAEDINGSSLNVSTLADTIWAKEYGGTEQIFIGESNGVSDNAPTAKTVTGFSNIRGLAPEEPSKLGGFYAGSLGLFGQENDVSTAQDEQNIDTLAIALASPLPRIEFPINGNTVTIVPFGKSVGGHTGVGTYFPTNTIVDFYIEEITPSINPTKYKFRINYEDVEQGSDHDMDAIVEYTVEVTGTNKVTVSLNSVYAAGSIIQHLGYIISGTTADGTYLDIRDADTLASNDIDYILDTPNIAGALPQSASREFTVGTTSASFIEHDPLWYASKWSTSTGDDTVLDTDEWDSDGDGTPDGYFLVTNAGKLDEQINNAFQEIVARTSSASGVATNSTRLDSNTKVYQARFDSKSWKGELLAFALDPNDGSLLDSDNDGIPNPYVWDAGEKIPTASTRKIFSYDSTLGSEMGILFEYGQLNSAQRTLLDTDHLSVVDSLGSDRVKFIRGDESKELHITDGIFRSRLGTDGNHFVLGDIVNSDPWFSGRVEDFGYTALPGTEGSKYTAFRQMKLSRTPAIYFGANDGMLHAINADSGDELFAYVPDAVIANLNILTSNLYGCSGQGNCIPHTYFVDGAPKVSDAYFDSDWHSILIGSTGAGGKSIFALDVTDPDNFSATDVLWELSNTTIIPGPPSQDQHFQDHLGYTLPQSSVVRMHTQNPSDPPRWAAIVANGYESTSQTAVLFIIDAETGAIIGDPIDTGVGDGTNPNGLSTPIPIDLDGDRIVDVIYAGDLHGNMWKFDVSSGNTTQWGIAFGGSPLYLAQDGATPANNQPITSKPQVGQHPDGGVMVYFGTGKYFEVSDQIIATPPKEQTFYGLRDYGSTIASKANLQEQEIQFETRVAALNLDVRVTSETSVDYTTKDGWYMDLVSPLNGAEGERAVSAPLLRGGRIIFTTLIPETDPCGFGGSSWLMELDAINGRRLDEAPFDIDQDGDFDIDDLVATLDTNGDDVVDQDDDRENISGIRQDGLGIIKTPGVVSTGNDTEVKYVSGTSGNLEVFYESAGEPFGRQSWRQLR